MSARGSTGALILAVGVAAGWGLPGCGGGEAGGAAADTMEVVASPDTVLSRVAGELLPEAERISGLEAVAPMALARRSRDELAGYLEGQLDEQLPRGRAQRLAAAYRRLGLLPDTLQLRPFLRELYMEQVAGYYDPAADTLFVMEGAQGERLRTVLVHELVHALQDQRVDLDSIGRALDEENDRSTAFQAAVEGHAMYVMTEWQVGQVTGERVDLTRMPGLMERIRESTAGGAAGAAMPTFESAPRILRETLIFPYIEGMGLMLHIWGERSGRPAPFGDLLPLSTEQVLHPDKLAGADADRPTRVSVDGLPEGWEELYSDDLGELEFGILLAEGLGDADRAGRLAAGWDGDLLTLARNDEGGEALTWIAVWDSEAGADSAASGLEEAMEGRYGEGSGRRIRIRRQPLEGRPGVVMVDFPADADAGPWLGLSQRARLMEVGG